MHTREKEKHILLACRRDLKGLKMAVDTCHFYTFYVIFLIEELYGACHLMIRESYFLCFVFLVKFKYGACQTVMDRLNIRDRWRVTANNNTLGHSMPIAK